MGFILAIQFAVLGIESVCHHLPYHNLFSETASIRHNGCCTSNCHGGYILLQSATTYSTTLPSPYFRREKYFIRNEACYLYKFPSGQ